MINAIEGFDGIEGLDERRVMAVRGMEEDEMERKRMVVVVMKGRRDGCGCAGVEEKYVAGNELCCWLRGSIDLAARDVRVAVG
ncbi:hypothetical protein TWF730_003006 [Orbilia blumenaviensis]|uniref:Uncharacterized protein n=1 Tax=Orbilia blumenaviensis TaxID=1796055 RepID=A0AAV9UBP7_9PEZI